MGRPDTQRFSPLVRDNGIQDINAFDVQFPSIDKTISHYCIFGKEDARAAAVAAAQSNHFKQPYSLCTITH